MRYSIEPTGRRYVKGYEFLSFAKNIVKRYGQKLVDTAKKSWNLQDYKYFKKTSK